MDILRISFYQCNDGEIEMFINLGGFESVFCLFSRSDAIIRTKIVDFLCPNFIKKFCPFLLENPIFVEQLKLVFVSELTSKKV